MPTSRAKALGQFATNGSVDFSPDGGRLVFYGAPNRLAGSPFSKVGLYVADRDGSNLRLVTNTSQGPLPHWSPDGQQITFASSLSGPVAVGADGSNRRVLFSKLASDWD